MGENVDVFSERLQRWKGGDQQAGERVWEEALPELRRLARYYMRKERQNHTIRPTELVNEAFLRLNKGRPIDWNNSQHFFAIVALVMRRFLIDYSKRRQPGAVVPIDDARLAVSSKKLEQAVWLDSMLDQLEEAIPGSRQIVELKFFLGMTDEETAEVLGMALKTMQRRWSDARVWLFEKYEEGRCSRGERATSGS